MVSWRVMHGAALVVAVLVGSALRLHGIRDQLLVSDEWHALHAAALLPIRELLGLVTFGATSIPMNVYARMLLDGPGWTELALRLPSLVAGVASLIVFPLLVRDLLRPRATLLFAGLLALSPYLVFYARYARPYEPAVLLTFVALVASYRWARSGSRSWAAVFASAGAVVGYLHVSEARVIVLPVLFLLAVKWLTRRGPNGDPVRPSPAALVVTGAVPLLVLGLLLLPGFLRPAQFLTSIAGRARPDAGTLIGTTEFLFGTADPLARGVLVALAAVGLLRVVRRDPLFGGLLLLVVAGSLATVLVTRPLDAEMPVVFARYVIAIYPIVFLAVADAADALLEWATRHSPFAPRATRFLADAAAVGGLVVLFCLGPLPALYAGRNDFTNHKALQGSYDRLRATNVYAVGVLGMIDDSGGALVDRFPPFYLGLAQDHACGAIIEYPLAIGDRYSPYFLYQMHHRKRVLGGYFHVAPDETDGGRPGVVQANWIVDRVLAEVADVTKLRFRNLVNLGDPDAVRAASACYLVVHTDIDGELRGERRSKDAAPPPPPDYVRRFGTPVYADGLTTVFDLRR